MRGCPAPMSGPAPLQSADQLLEDLNPPQREAVLHGDGPLLVLAGAGSGKTRVITRRVAHLVLARRVAPWRILAVTFTNKAAREMRERLGVLLGPWASELNVATFHSAAATILRREAEKVGLTRSFVIYDDADQLQLVKRAMREERVDPVLNPRDVLRRIDVEKNAGRGPDVERVPADDYRALAVQRAYRAYQRLLRAANAVDFGDLLLLLVQLLRKDSETLEKYRARFQHVLVDEFQDTNPVQYELLQQLAPPPGANLVVVGDDDQSIYRWRGAEVSNILQFPDLYRGARVVKLEQNYRSDGNILDAANAVISQNPRRMPKRLWTERPKGELLHLLISRDEREEAHEVARRIHALHKEDFVSYEQMAIFYRVNAQSRVLEEALRLSRVPYTLVSGRSFYERAEIKDAASYLRLMANPRSDADLLRIVNVPARAIGDTTQERLSAWAAEQGISLWEALDQVESIDMLQPAAQKRLRGFRALMEPLVQFAVEAPSAAAALERMLQETRLVESLMEAGDDESLGRAENLREFVGAAQEFDLQRAARPPPGPERARGRGPAAPGLPRADQPGGRGRRRGRRRARLADDAARGEGARVRRGVSPRHGGRRLSPPARARRVRRRRGDGGGAAALLRRLHPRPEAALLSLAQARSLFGELRFNPPSRFLREVPKELFDFQPELRAPAPQPSYGRVERRPRPDDTGPRIDRSYAQEAAYMEDGSVVGMRVRHAQFGDGEVMACDGTGPNAKLTVRFRTVGLKRVIARFLQPA